MPAPWESSCERHWPRRIPPTYRQAAASLARHRKRGAVRHRFWLAFRRPDARPIRASSSTSKRGMNLVLSGCLMGSWLFSRATRTHASTEHTDSNIEFFADDNYQWPYSHQFLESRLPGRAKMIRASGLPVALRTRSIPHCRQSSGRKWYRGRREG